MCRRLMVLCAVLAVWTGVNADTVELIRAYALFEQADRAGDVVQAMKHLDAVIAMSDSARERAELLMRRGKLAERTGDTRGAASSYLQALGLLEIEAGVAHPDLVPVLEAVAKLRWKSGDYAGAEILILRVATIETATYGAAHPNPRLTLTNLREAYSQLGRPEDVSRIEREIRALVVEHGSPRGASPGREGTRPPPPKMPAPEPKGVIDGAARRSLLLERGLDPRYTIENGSATVRVFYGTNRAPSGIEKPAEFYSTERGELTQGYVDVSIPESHERGELERQSRWSLYTYVLGDEAKRKRYVMLLKVEPLEESDFLGALRDHIAGSPSNDVFLFVHGYNSSFEDASMRAAQLAYDLDFDGTPMLFSWPSQATTAAYSVDEAAVKISGRRLAVFLDTLLNGSGADRVHLIAHSMGNRAMIEALQTMLAKRSLQARSGLFGQIVFTAPDVDRDYFVDALDDIEGAAERVTLYASDNDFALQTSELFHGAPRAGLAGDGIVTRAGIDTIDMSQVEADMLGHNYFAANEGAIYDLFRLLWRGDPPPRRCGMNRSGEHGFWRFDVVGCQGGAILQAGLLLKRYGVAARERVRERLTAMTDPDERARWSLILDKLEQLMVDDGA